MLTRLSGISVMARITDRLFIDHSGQRTAKRGMSREESDEKKVVLLNQRKEFFTHKKKSVN